MILIPMIIAVWTAYWFYRKTLPALTGWRRFLLCALRSVSLLLIVIFLFNPILSFIQKKTSAPGILLLSDVSESMSQSGNVQTKAEAYISFKDRILTKYTTNNYEVVNFNFADGLNGAATNTDLTRTLQELNRKKSLTDVREIFLFSDGWLKDDNLAILDDLNLPINVVIPQFDFSDFDLEINDLRYNKSVYKDEVSPLQTFVSSQNFSGKAKLDLKIAGKTIISKKIDFSKSSFQEVYFENIFTTPGLQNFEVVIHSDSTGETNIANNTFPAAVQVLENRLKCLLVADKLTWDESFIIDALSSDPYWESVFLLKQTDFLKAREMADFGAELRNANVLILSNHADLRFSRQEAELITRFVAAGGSILTIGKIISEIDPLLPASASNLKQQFTAQLSFTEESRKYQTFRFESVNTAANIPPVDYFYVNPKYQAEILARMNNEQSSPAILFHSYEKGKAVHFALANLWKWQLRTADDQYRKFMRDLINWLGRKSADRLIVQTDKNSYFSGEPVKFSAVAFDEKLVPMTDLNLRIKLFDEKESEIVSEYLLAGNQEFNLLLRDLKAGTYRYRIDDDISGLAATGEFSISAFNPESRDRGINAALLSYLANRTDGKIITAESLENLTVAKADLIGREMKREIQLYRKWYLIAIFLICFCTELFFRKHWGML